MRSPITQGGALIKLRAEPPSLGGGTPNGTPTLSAVKHQHFIRPHPLVDVKLVRIVRDPFDFHLNLEMLFPNRGKWTSFALVIHVQNRAKGLLKDSLNLAP